MKLLKKKKKKQPLIFTKVNFLLGLTIILASAVIGAYAIWERGWHDWYGIDLLSPEDTAQMIILFREQEKLTPDQVLPGRSTRLDMGIYNGQPNFTKNFTKYDKILKEVAEDTDIDCTLIKAQMLAESRGNANAISNRGAKGLMQLMPLTAKAMGVVGNLFDPKNSLTAGARYIKHLFKTACHEKKANEVCDTDKDYKYIFAAYNGGSRANDSGLGRCSHIAAWECADYDAYFETRVYVNRVKANYDSLKDNNWGC